MNKKILLKTLLTTSTVGILGGGIASSLVLSSCSNKSEKNLIVEITRGNSGIADTDLTIEGSWKAANFNVKEGELELTQRIYTSFRPNYKSKTFTAILRAQFLSGQYSLTLQTNNIVSNKNIISIISPAQKALQINVSTPTVSANGVILPISGTYEAINIDYPVIELVGSDSSIFAPLNIDYYDRTFTTSLPANTPIGDYDLQLVAKSSDGDVLSNVIHFTVIPFAASDGSNWSGRTSGNVVMELYDEDMTAKITGNNDYVANDLVIPEKVLGNGKFYKVTSIGDNAFDSYYRSVILTGNLTIPSSVTNIGTNAFFGCNSLTGSLTIPNGVESIGEGTFANCNGFTGPLTIPNGVTSIGDGAFAGCTGFTGSLTIPNGVTSIGDGAFANCIFNHITLDGFLEQPSWRGGNIFENWHSDGIILVNGSLSASQALTYLINKGLPDSWTAQALTIAVSTSTFADGNETITGTFTAAGIDDPDIQLTGDDKEIFSNFSTEGNTFSVTISSAITAGDYSLQLIASGVKSNIILCTVYGNDIGTNWFGRTSGSVTMSFNSEDLTAAITNNNYYIARNLVIPDNVISDGIIYQVTSIGNRAFFECSGFTGSLTIGSGVKSIGREAFNACSGLTGSLTIPNGVTSIGDGAFANCTGFTGSLTIPNSVTSIGEYAFGACSGFNNITLDGFDSAPSWDFANIFAWWGEVGTVSVYSGDWAITDALTFLINKGLPSTWTATAYTLSYLI